MQRNGKTDDGDKKVIINQLKEVLFESLQFSDIEEKYFVVVDKLKEIISG